MQNSAEQEVAFLRKLQRLLDEGDFSSTYKFALIQALADLAVENQPAPDGALTLSFEQIAEKFIEYYWRQALPYREQSVLLQNNNQQAAVISLIMRQRDVHDGNLTAFRSNTVAWQRALKDVAVDVKRWPVAHLQNVGGETDEFLFRRSEIRKDRLSLLSGVASALRSFHPFVIQLVRGSWVGKIRKLGGNQPLLGSMGDLHEFLFGCDRNSLDGFRAVLRDYQSSRCFYCRKYVQEGEADHFIPWSRYMTDLGHNFVYACKPCNRAKREYLAGVDHLSRWRDANITHGPVLSQAFAGRGLAHELARTEFIASWAYEQAERAGAHAWLGKGQFARIDAAWQGVLLPLSAVAEPPANYRVDPT